MYRVLVFGMTENPGGVESFLINYYRHVDRDRIQFDFLCNTENSVAYEEEILALGGRCFHIPSRSSDIVRFKRELEKVFKMHAKEWNAIWVNVCSLANIDYLIKARKYGIKRRIIHSHNTENMDGKLRGILHNWNKKRIGEIATEYWACSSQAAEWFYPEKELKKTVVVHNAIDPDQYSFDVLKRNNIRRQYGWDGKFIIGNIGRLHFQKNQSFLIDVFSLYHSKNSDSILVLVGQGEDEEELKRKAVSLGVSDSVFFVGVQRDIQAWLSSFDVFAFPSVFEGLGIALLEAQANGLPILAAKDRIPQNVKINSNFKFMNLEDGEQKWAKEIEKMNDTPRITEPEIKKSFQNSGYEISEEAKIVERYFVGSL